MKAQDSDPNDERLRRALHEWKVKPVLPPRFQDAVWRRIEARETRVPAWMELIGRLVTAVARPSVATSYLAVLVLAGVLAGYWQARSTNEHAEEMLSVRYVQLMDPYQNAHH